MQCDLCRLGDSDPQAPDPARRSEEEIAIRNHGYRSRILLLLCAGWFTLPSAHTQTNDVSPGTYTVELSVRGTERSYLLHVPTLYDPAKATPLVIVLHGGGGTGQGTREQTAWDLKADKENFLVVFPEGTRRDTSRPARFAGNPQTWNDGSGRFPHEADDVGFIDVLIDDVRGRLNVDDRRVYVTGFSNGASMTYRLAAELSDRIAAAAPVAGALWIANPSPSSPVPLLYITGAADPLNPLEGGVPRMAIGGRGIGGKEKPPVSQQIESWIRALGCGETPSSVVDEEGIRTVVYKGCRGDVEALFVTIEGHGHVWPGGEARLPFWVIGDDAGRLQATDYIWEFFQRWKKR